MDSIGYRLRTLRKELNLTQKEFSKRLLVSQPYLSGLESGGITPTSKLTKLICLEFGIREDWLLNGNGKMYDEIYDNDKASLVEASNSALLQIMLLLTAESNIEYGHYAYSLQTFASMLADSKFFAGDLRLKYLENIENFVMDLERMICAATANPQISIENHIAEVRKDLEQLFAVIEEISSQGKDE